MVAGGGAIAAIKNKQYLKIFKQYQAVGKENAKELKDMGLEDNVVIKRLVKLHALEVCEKGHFVTESFAKTKRLAGI